MAGLDIEEEENEAFVLDGEVAEVTNKYELCIVGRFLTEKSINVRAMSSKMADIWRPSLGINIKEIEQVVFLFQFYHKEDLNWVVRGGPWSFDNAILILAEIPMGEEPLRVPLWHINIWIQIFDLSSGFMTEGVGKQLRDFFGEFLEYDQKNNTSLWREYMRVRVKLDVRRPLKRRKKITRRNGPELIVSCKYERLGDFCFTCGLLSHTERYCRKFLNRDKEVVDKEWGSWLRAQPRRGSGMVKSKWLRDDGDTNWEEKQGRVNGGLKSGVDRNVIVGNSWDHGRISRQLISNEGKESYCLITEDNIQENSGGKVDLNFIDGPEGDELIGLQILERKRMRGGPTNYETMDTAGGLQVIAKNKNIVSNSGVVLSAMDCLTPSHSEMATLAVQASQKP